MTDKLLGGLDKTLVGFKHPDTSAGDSFSPEGPLISLDQIHPLPNQDLSSTRPAVLRTPEAPQRHEHGGIVPVNVMFPYLYRLGKAYVTFYKTGLKNVWLNYKEYRDIKKRLGPLHINDVVKYGGKDGLPTISRREYQLCLRTRHDLGKLIPFCLIFLVCGEFTPLVVAALGSAVVPSTCRIPKQVTKDHIKSLKRVAKAVDVGVDLFKENAPFPVTEAEALVGYVWGLMPSPRPLPLIHSLFRPRVVRRADELLCDAILVRREGGIANLSAPEAFDFMMQASEGRFLKICLSAAGTPGNLRANQQKLKELEAPHFEAYTDKTLERLRVFEHDPRKHYLAGLRF